MTTLEQRIEIMQEILYNAENVCLLRFDANGILINTSGDDDFPTALFQESGMKDTILEKAKNSSYPILVSDQLEISWLAVPYLIDSVLVNIFVIGPVLPSPVSETYLTNRLRQLNFSKEARQDIIARIQKLPNMSHQMLIHYGLTLYYCIYSTRISVDKVQITSKNDTDSSGHKNDHYDKAREASYILSLELFKSVEDGNVDFSQSAYMLDTPVGTMSSGDPLRQAKNMIITFITRITESAIKGGLPIVTAFNLSDFYIISVEACTNSNDAYQTGMTALKDFTKRVKDTKEKKYSAGVNSCIHYIQKHKCEQIKLSEMAEFVGYSKNYLGAIFVKETGRTLGQYIFDEKMELAAIRLKDHSASIQGIAYGLGYESASYFTKEFKRKYGMTPNRYRESI